MSRQFHHPAIRRGSERSPPNPLLTFDDLLDIGFQTLDLVVVRLHRLLLVTLGFQQLCGQIKQLRVRFLTQTDTSDSRVVWDSNPRSGLYSRCFSLRDNLLAAIHSRLHQLPR